jgi:hypothetical protein
MSRKKTHKYGKKERFRHKQNSNQRPEEQMSIILLLNYCKQGNWQALTGAGLLDLLFGLLGFGQIKHR